MQGANDMKKTNIHKFLFGISVLLVLGFIVHTIVDAVRYDSMLTSFPFYAFIIAHAVEYLVPALVICVAGLTCKKKFAKKED